MTASERGCLCIFAKPPRAGLVKTRLTGALGDEGAAQLASAFFEDTWAVATSVAWADCVLATTEVDAPEWRLPQHAIAWPQGDGNLGRRLEQILGRALATHDFALAIGTDSPGMPSALLDAARIALRSADAVIGPTEDGGFYLLGLRACPTGLLAGIPWSRTDTCARTVGQLRRFGLRVAVLPPWFDVDRPEDLDRLRMMVATGRLSAPATTRALVRLEALADAARGSPGRWRTLRVSLIVPVLDEEARIDGFLRRALALGPLHEIIVVDGGSTDRTVQVAAAVRGCRVITAPRGRSQQLNAGARVATGDALWFAHADVRLPADGLALIARTLAEPAVAAGAFRIRTVPDGARGWAARWLPLADLRSRYTRLPYGDQAVFVRRHLFEAAGGFPDQPLFEDLELSRRIRRLGHVRAVRSTVEVSGRRFMARPFYYAAAMTVLPVLYRVGVSAATLARAYRPVR